MNNKLLVLIIFPIILIVITTTPFFAKAASLKIYFGGKILDVITFSLHIGGQGVSLGPIGKIKDDESKRTIFIFTPAALGVCKKGGHIVGIGINAKFYSYKYIQPILAYCDND